MYPFPMIFVIESPEIPSGSIRLASTESPVKYQILVASRERAAVLIAPVSVELSFRVTDIELISSVRSDPGRSQFVAVKKTVPPFLLYKCIR